jgi:UDP-N-acetylglucosamine 4,6-dehydratase
MVAVVRLSWATAIRYSQEYIVEDGARQQLSGKVFLTGGAGFLGRAIIRRAQREDWPCTFTVFSRDEEKQWQLREKYGKSVTCYLGSVRDHHTLTTLMPGHDLVIHLGAVKFIPEAERNVWEAVHINLDGSRNVVRAAAWCHVPTVVGISTDKAVLPANVYGMTKALMERLYAEACRWSERINCVTVRYGNVVGSTGSIVPVFRQQLKTKQRLSVTDERMTRFWLSPDEAVDAILLAVANAKQYPGASFVPKCGAMKIMDLARLIAGEAPIDIIGIRPGEKLHEELVNFQESPQTIDKGDYFVARHPTGKGVGGSAGASLLPEGKEGWTYRSHNPAHWITMQEMAAMLKDAEGV